MENFIVKNNSVAEPPGKASVAVLVLWAVAVSVPLTFLMGSHWLPLPTTSPMQFVAVTSNRNWQAVHILVADCPCSEFVATHLATRGASSELNETVWLVGGDAPWAQTLEQRGFRVRHEDANRLAAEYGIHGGPWLQLISPAGTLAYSGGYAPERPRSDEDFRDLAIWRSVARGETVEKYPAFGCAASSWLRQKMDPLAIKYGK